MKTEREPLSLCRVRHAATCVYHSFQHGAASVRTCVLEKNDVRANVPGSALVVRVFCVAYFQRSSSMSFRKVFGGYSRNHFICCMILVLLNSYIDRSGR